jgi:hypothetical protein
MVEFAFPHFCGNLLHDERKQIVTGQDGGIFLGNVAGERHSSA